MPEYEYDCIVYKQRPDQADVPAFCIFHAPAGEVLEWADIERLETGPGGAQRAVNQTKVGSVKRFLEDTANTIPTAVILSLDIPDEAQVRGDQDVVRTIRFHHRAEDPKPGLVIDGQHRLLGAKAFDPQLRLNVVAMLSGDPDEAAFQFLVINNKAAKVPTDHIKGLLAERDDDLLKERLRKARLSISPRYGFVAIADADDESPFREQIDWPVNRQGAKLVKPAAIETAFKDIQDRKVREFDDQDTLVEYFFTIWRVTKARWGAIWNADAKLLNKVGVVCMTHYITNSIVSSYDLGEFDVTNMNRVDERVQQLLEMQKPEFWTANWSSAGYDTQAGRKAIVDSLVQIARNVRHERAWTEDVEVLATP